MAAIEGKRISDLANNASIDGTAIFPHTQNGSTMRVSLSSVTDYILAQVDEDTVKDAVNEWMTNHPDVTTTVQDGAISTVKLANDAVTSEKIKNGTIAGIDLSMDLLNAICASGSASGSVATFPDGAYGLPLKSCIVSVNPVQAGSGDPSPTNIRPITGWTGANVIRTGRNIFGGNLLRDGIKASIPTASDYADIRAIDYAVTVPAYGSFTKAVGLDGKFKENTAYTFIVTLETTQSRSTNMRIYYTDGTHINIPDVSGINTKETKVVVTSPNKTVWSISRVYSDTSVTRVYYDESGLFEGVLTLSDFEQYIGETYPITWSEAGTVYGGTLDVINGTLTKEYESVDLGTRNWSYNSSIGAFYSSLPDIITTGYTNAMKAPIVCDKYVTVAYYPDGAGAFGGNDKCVAFAFQSGRRLYVKDSAYTDVATFNAAISGTMLVYKLAEPVTYQLAPTEITTLIGENNIWADCGEVSVEYFAKTQTYIEQRINATKSIITGVEAGFIATKNYAIGDLMIVGDTLYIATAAIANGGTITPGTNVTATTVADNLGGSLPSAQGVSF